MTALLKLVGHMNLKVGQFMKDNGREIREKVLVHRYGVMVQNI